MKHNCPVKAVSVSHRPSGDKTFVQQNSDEVFFRHLRSPCAPPNFAERMSYHQKVYDSHSGRIRQDDEKNRE